MSIPYESAHRESLNRRWFKKANFPVNAIHLSLEANSSTLPTKSEFMTLHFIKFISIGQIPTHDGLFGEPRLAYFSGLPLGLRSVRICGAL
jgi:hypothetical protein